MKKCLIATALLTLTLLAAHAEIRKWTSTAGGTIKAEFVKLENNKVFLKTADGKIKQIPKAKLIKSDQLLVTKLSSPFYDPEKEKAAAEAPKASPALYRLFGDELRNNRKKKVSTDLLAGKTVGIYFSAHWCPPCRAFTPELVKFHKELTRKGKPFEIVFVSSDHDKSSMYNYMKEMDMPWLALPFNDDHKKSLSQKYGITGIPTLVIINPDGELITKNGRGNVTQKGADAFDGWK